MFYMVAVQAVLLYESETWSSASSSLKRLEEFHIRIVWQMAGKRPARNEDGSWTYPHLEEVRMAVGLKTITCYMGVHCQTIANFNINQLIYELCAGAVRKRGLPVPPFRWDQPMDLDLVREEGQRPSSQQGTGPVATARMTTVLSSRMVRAQMCMNLLM
jgi:hypothetical protein